MGSEMCIRDRATNAPRGSGRERHFSSMLWRQRRLERFLSSILHFRGGAESSSGAFRGFGADSSGTCRAFCGSWARSSVHFEPGSSGHFASQLRLRARLEQPFRTSCGSGPGSSRHFEPTAAPGQARCRKHRQVRCFRARPSRVRPKPRKRVRNPKTEGNFKNRYNRMIHSLSFMLHGRLMAHGQ